MPGKKLLYRTVPHNGGLVFATPKRALLVDRIHRAIETSRTWEQFRKAMPRSEYSEIIRSYDQQGEPRPRGSDEFSCDSVPGYFDGDYPPWLQAEMDAFEEDVWREFGTSEPTMLNGDFWLIPKQKRRAVCAALRERGWDVEHAPKLKFW